MNERLSHTKEVQSSLEARVDEVLTRGVVETVDSQHLKERMLGGEKLRVKFGIDPTGPNIHIGRASAIRKLAQFQELGHQVVFIIGDFTAQIGDASDKVEGRRMLGSDEVAENERLYLEQIGRILDISKTEVHHNSEWLDSLKPGDWVKLASNFSVQQMVARQNFAQRIQKGINVGVHELLYPIVQGYDSVMVGADVELGGTDQLFNLMAGRKLQEAHGQEPQDIMTMQLLAGTDGRKMSTSWGNVITITAPPEEKYGKIMSIADQLIPVYMEMATNIPMERVSEVRQLLEEQSINPLGVKKELAHEIVRALDGEQAAGLAQQYFERTVQRKELPDEQAIPFANINGNSITMNGLLDLFKQYNITKSKADGRRLVEGNSVYTQDGSVLSSDIGSIEIPTEGLIIRVGKRRYIKLLPGESIS